MRSPPHDTSVLEHQDLVGVGDGRHPLGDDQYRRVGRVAGRSAVLSRAAVATSSAENESSKTYTCGSTTSARAMARR